MIQNIFSDSVPSHRVTRAFAFSPFNETPSYSYELLSFLCHLLRYNYSVRSHSPNFANSLAIISHHSLSEGDFLRLFLASLEFDDTSRTLISLGVKSFQFLVLLFGNILYDLCYLRTKKFSILWLSGICDNTLPVVKIPSPLAIKLCLQDFPPPQCGSRLSVMPLLELFSHRSQCHFKRSSVLPPQ